MAPAPIDYATYSRILDQADALVRKSGKGSRLDALHAFMRAYPEDHKYAAAVRMASRSSAPAPAVVAKVAPLRKAAEAPTPAYNEIVLQGDALFRAGLAGSTWEGMGQYAVDYPDVFEAYVAECRRANAQPDARVTKAMAALAPPQPALSATDALMDQIAQRQAAEPGLTFVQALDAVEKQAPELYERYTMEMRYHPEARTRPVAKAEAPTVEQILNMAQEQAAAEGRTTAAVLEKLHAAHPEPVYYTAYCRWHGSLEALREHHAAGQAQGRTGQAF